MMEILNQDEIDTLLDIVGDDSKNLYTINDLIKELEKNLIVENTLTKPIIKINYIEFYTFLERVKDLIENN